MNKYVLAWHDSAKNTGGSKAKADVIHFLTQKDFKVIETPINNWEKIWASLNANRTISKLSDGVLLIQYPSGKPFLRRLWLKAAIKKRKLKVILLIHDLEAIRFYNNQAGSNQRIREIRFLNQADGLISLNQTMTRLLRKHGITIPITDLKVWDYDNPQNFNDDLNYRKSVCYAGNLTKSTFLAQMDTKAKLHVFGPNASITFPKSVVFEGMYSPQELPAHLKQNFGLVWDGTSTKTCTGTYGQYLRYNDPHKVSLYLSTGLPVIVWDQAAIAEFIRKNSVGITIDNLNNLDTLLSSISKEQFIVMKHNAQKIGTKMRNGYYLYRACQDLIAQLYN